MDVSRVELWCPGPSLIPHKPTTDWIITVNRAALALWPWRSGVRHWAVAHDAPVIRDLSKFGQFAPNCILTDTNAVFEVAAYMPATPIYPQEWLKGRCADIRFKYSKLEAFALAHLMGAKEINVYGDDCAGDLDWDGVAAGKRRNEERWQSELSDTQHAREILAKRGCTIIWHR